jgi:polysaccharide deacetylase 2 family uncharacterized protein YibQ
VTRDASRGSTDERRSSFRSVAYLTLVPVCAFGVFWVWNWWRGHEVSEFRGQQAAVGTPQPRTPATPPPANPAAKSPGNPLPAAIPPKPARTETGSIVLIIDDLGFDGQPLDRLMKLDPNINVAILPNGTRAAEFAERLNARGFEILCHLPMEPKGPETPGANAILTSMSDDEIARATRANVEAVPYARGVNNHMGSRATTDRRVMSRVMEALPEGMYFIDSRTTGGSVAADVARELNVPTATRHVFLDDVATEAAVRRQLEQLADAAANRGVAIGIGHPYPVTLRVLADELPELKARGFRLVRASAVVR